LALVSAVVIALSLGCTTTVDASPVLPPYKADSANCRPATPPQLAWLDGPAWARFAPYVRVCDVRQGRGPVAMLIASVWEEAYYADQPDNAPQVEMPLPQLFAPDGRKLGELPHNFPTDAPAELQLRFADWANGLPGEIRLCVITPTTGGNFALAPLRIGASGRFESTGKKPVPSLTDDCHGR
jgi:hypothetical protein